MEPPGDEQNEPHLTGEPKMEPCETKESTLSMKEKEMLRARAKKASDIRKACASHDVEELVRHATSEGGLLEDELRQIACKSPHSAHEGEISQLTISQGLCYYNVTQNFQILKRPIAKNFRIMPRKTRLILT